MFCDKIPCQIFTKIKNYLDLRTILYPIAAIKIDISGEIRLNRQYGRYVIVLTFSTVACVIPQEFQGTRTETTVAESSTERLSSLLSYPLS